MKFALTLLFAASIFAAPTLAADAGSPAPAQPQQAPYAPVVLNQADMNMITNYLGAMPFNQAAPLMFFFTQKEAEAQAAAAKKK